MTKNEQDVIERTIASLVGKVDEIFLYDTGSQDDTIRLAVECANRGSTPIQTTRGPWVDFATSRNEAIAFVETSRPGDDVWILLVDANDVVDDDNLDEVREMSIAVDGCYLIQQWRDEKTVTEFCELRLIRAGRGWRYRYPVHELLEIPKNPTPICRKINVTLSQDRRREREKSHRRKSWDEIVLRNALVETPRDTRLLFYFANTLLSLGRIAQARDAYKKRISLRTSTNRWETYESLLRIALCCAIDRKPHEAISWYLRATAFSKSIGDIRHDGTIEAGRIYRQIGQYELAFALLNEACRAEDVDGDKPGMKHRVLYDHVRWHELAFAAWQTGRWKIGERACRRAIIATHRSCDRAVDEKNLSWFSRSRLLNDVWFINLDSREDRRSKTLKELAKIHVQNPTRVSATRNQLGVVGCLQSHIETLKLAMKSPCEFAAIFEDDVHFLDPVKTLSSIRHFEDDDDWDVLLLGGMNDGGHESYKSSRLAVRVRRCMSCVAYIVRKKFVPILLKFWENQLSRIMNATSESLRLTYPEISLDVAWWSLQEKHVFLLATPLCVVQREDFSDICDKVVSYEATMLTLEPTQDWGSAKYKIRAPPDAIAVVDDRLVAREAVGANLIVCDFEGRIVTRDQLEDIPLKDKNYAQKIDENRFILPSKNSHACLVSRKSRSDRVNCKFVADMNNFKGIVVACETVYPGDTFSI